MRVFVLEPTEYSMFKAKKFGPLVFLFSDESKHFPWHDPGFMSQVDQAFRENSFDPSEDAIAVSGKMIDVSIMLAVAVWLYGDVRLLCFDHDKDVRNFREVDLSALSSSMS